MTKNVDTAFERHFSEPPVVTVKTDRTHCEACKEPLAPDVMHKCAGNQEYQAPVISSTEITEKCPECAGDGIVVKQEMFGLNKTITSYAVVCGKCRTYLWPLVQHLGEAIEKWNRLARSGGKGCWPKFLAHLPGDDERANVIPSDTIPSNVKASHPDLSGYKGACPAVHIEGHECPMCEGTNVIPPTKPEDER